MAGMSAGNLFYQPQQPAGGATGGVAVKNPFYPVPPKPAVVPSYEQQQASATKQTDTDIATKAQQALAAHAAEIAANQQKSSQAFEAQQTATKYGQQQTLAQQQAAAEAALQNQRLAAGQAELKSSQGFTAGQNTQTQGAALNLQTNQQAADAAAFQAKVAANNAMSDKEYARFKELSAPFLGGAGTGGATGGGVGDAADLAAQDAAFGRAKDRVGAIGRAGLTGLREAMASRGILGSGIESAGTGQVFGEAAGGLGEVARDQAIASYQEAGKRADRNVTKRGQDMGYLQSLMGLMRSGGSLY